MSRFLNLTSDELYRSRHYFLGIVLFVLVGEGIGAIHFLYNFTHSDYASGMTFHLIQLFDATMPFFFTLAGAIMAMLIYCIISWQRESTGKSRFMYRLLTLPGNRLSIPLAKITSILLMIFGLLFLQLVIYEGAHLLCQLFYPGQYQTTQITDVFLQRTYFNPISLVIFPYSLPTFLIYYGWGTNFLFLLFNVLTMWQGLQYRSWIVRMGLPLVYEVMGVGISAVIVWLGSFYLTPGEMQWLNGLLILVIGAFQLLLMKYLMDHTMTV
ncbi:MAG: hypothetical protein Q4A55_06430 [Aerococcus sp.]|nr:hypothetical protein [Aerococcus sp.]